jgi:hypothetical protein
MTCRNLYSFVPVRTLASAALRATTRKSRTSIMVAALCLCASASLPSLKFEPDELMRPESPFWPQERHHSTPVSPVRDTDWCLTKDPL